jgi:hypothetical protein
MPSAVSVRVVLRLISINGGVVLVGEMWWHHPIDQ